MANKYLALQKDVFDISKVTVVGSPTITSDGVASGFSANNYITIPNYIANKDNFKITGKWTCGAVNETILGLTGQGWGSILRTWDSGRGLLCGLTTQDIYTNTGNCVVGQTYFFYVEYKNGVLTLGISEDGENYTTVVAKDQVLKICVSTSENIYLGVSADYKGSLYMQGSIDLTQFKIYVDGQLVFQPVKPTYLLERRKEGYDPSKFTVVGSPTITEYGVASGFSSSNYIQIKNQKLGSTTKLSIKAKRQTLGTADETFFRIVDGSGRIWRFYSNTNGTLDYICNGVYGILGCSLNNTDDFIFNVEITPEEFKFSCSKNGQETNILNPIRTRDYINIFSTSNDYYIDLGSYSNVNGFLGSIDLPSISITVDGKEVFTGAKEQFYALRR